MSLNSWDARISLHLIIFFPLFVVYSIPFSVSTDFPSWSLPEVKNSLEFAWRIFPITMVMTRSSCSFWLSRDLSDFSYYDLCVVAVAQQWFWSFNFSPCFLDEPVEVYGLQGFPDCKVRVPRGCTLLLRCTSLDVIHNLGCPSLGLKLDCIPHSMTETVVWIKQGSYYGCCYEFCGSFHSQMPFSLVFL